MLKNLIGDDADKFRGDGADLFRACAERALEGILSKHLLAPYRSGRSKSVARSDPTRARNAPIDQSKIEALALLDWAPSLALVFFYLC